MYVEELNNTREWEDFVESMPTGTFYHSLKWKEVIEKSFPHRAIYLVVKDSSGKLVGVAPGFFTESIHTKIYDSIPHSDYGGPLIKTPHVSKVSIALLDFLKHLSSSRGVTYGKFLVIEKALKNHLSSQKGYAQSSLGVMEINLAKTPSQFIWNVLFSSNRRKKFKQMERRGFHVYEARTKSDLKAFYNLYLQNMEHIGASPRSFSFMENAWDTLFPSYLRIWILVNKEPVAAKLFFQFAKKSFSVFVGIKRDQPQTYTNVPASPINYLTWAEIKKAEEECISCVSLGTTPNDPSSEYFLRKSSMGSSFYPQWTVWTPFNTFGRVLVQMRSTSVSLGKTVRPFLPDTLTRILEDKVDAL